GGTQWIIEGVVPVGHLTWLYGRGESGKSLLALHCCISIAQGATEWLGFPVNRELLEGRSVVYLDFEQLGEDEPLTVAQRVGKLALPAAETVTPFYYISDGLPVTKSGAADFDKLGAMLYEFEPALVVVDSFQYAHNGDANDTETVTATMKGLRDLCKAYNCGVVVIDHIPKSDARANSETALPYGSVYKTNGSRSQILIRAVEDEETGDGETYYELKLTKASLLEPSKRWETRLVCAKETDGRLELTHEVLFGRLGRIVEYLRTHEGATAKQILEYLKGDEPNLDNVTVHRSLHALLRDGRIRREGNRKAGYKYHLRGGLNDGF
ncbi:MAG: AAA family ATPase, partial [Chlorobi bacterium]|nr:AAA family ATPase [Chlorobiota bacterium]